MTRRAAVFGALGVGTFSVLMGRLYYLQFLRGSEYEDLAEGNRVKIQLLAPVRGVLTDRKGVELAGNQKNFRLYLDCEATNNPRKVLEALAGVLNLSPQRIDQVVTQAKASRYAPPVLIREHLTWDELSQFEFYRLSYPEVYVDTGQVRYYPLGEQASHLIGYVGAVAESETEGQEQLARLPDFKIGKSGVEKMLEQELRGAAGLRQTEVNVHGLAVRELSRNEGKAGTNIRLTIDTTLQRYTAARLGEESAAAVVMDVRNGNVLALASMPSYEPNSFSKGITTKYWGELQKNKRNPLLNKAIAGQYPPGSTFKMCVGLAALKAGLTDTGQHVFCNGKFYLGNHGFGCWKPGGHGSVNLLEALAQSCDVYFYTMAQRLGIDRIAAMSRMLGLGKPTGIGLPNEKGAVVPDDDWKRESYNQGWQGGDTINVGIGQGYILTTPMQLAVMAARLATGTRVVPRLTGGDEPVEFEELDISESHLRAVQAGMNAVCNGPTGTAYGKRIADERFLMAGKTGTSQVRKLIQLGLDQNKLPWEDRHHALFVGYAPVAAPRFAASVIVEHGGGGASAAAPVVRDLLHKIQAIEVGEEGPPLPQDIPPPPKKGR